ncbi:MAG TPA: membrane-bound lytic murein transglycosylase MltF [Woeseiaceae bacterium]
MWIYALLAALLNTCSQTPPLLDQIRDRGELRVVTRYAPTTYSIGPDGPQGPEFDLVAGFAEELGVTLVLETVDSVSEVLPRLLSGEADLAAAGLSLTDSRRDLVDFGYPYTTVDMHLVYRLGTGRPRGIADLIGKRIEVVAGSSHAEMLAALAERYPGLEWTENADVEVVDLLEKVANGEIDYTVADSTNFNIQRHFYPELRVALDLRVADPIAWAFPRNGDRLLALADDYLIRARREGLLAQIEDRYYGHAEQFDYVGTRAFIRHYESRLPHYRALFEQAGKAYGIDWRLLAAIGYQESHWRPQAVSPTGVRGIMMLTRATADYLDIKDRVDPESSIFGGAEFFAEQLARLPETVLDPDRTWMALAAYNVGFLHLMDARHIVQWEDGDPDAWVDVSETLPLLARERWYSRVEHGYARGWEPVLYVNNVRNYYNIICWLTENGTHEPAGTLEAANSEPAVTAGGS